MVKRRNEQITKEPTTRQNSYVSPLIRKTWLPNIALVVDQPNWAFDHISDEIKRYLSNQFNFFTIYSDFPEYKNPAKLLFALKDFDLIHVFWRGRIGTFDSPSTKAYLESIGLDYEHFIDTFLKPLNFSTAVYDHLLLDEKNIKITENTLNMVNNYYVSSNKLFSIYQELTGIPKPITVIPDGVDTQIFRPINIERFDSITSRPLKVGWVGNSNWEWGGAGIDLKGIKTIIEPTIERLQKKGIEINIIKSDRNEKMIPFYEMPSFYADIDIYVCASEYEGTPNPVLEAMSCGVPIISTDVGIVTEALGPLQKEFVIKSRTIEDLEQTIIRLISNPELFKSLSTENLEYIQKWDWKYRIKPFSLYFHHCLGMD